MELTTDPSLLAVITLGFVIGLKHAFEADHLAAVSAMVTERKGSVFAASAVGGLWGTGHTLSLLIVGILVILFKLQIPESLEAKFEGAVGVMLVILGLNAIRKIVMSRREHSHSHDVDSSSTSTRLRSVLVGMMHGLAGSAGLMLLIVPTINSPFAAVIYIIVFGVGSILGMMLMSIAMSLPLMWTADRDRVLNVILRTAAGVFSLVWGLFLINEKLIAG